jgi:hypothetical protein
MSAQIGEDEQINNGVLIDNGELPAVTILEGRMLVTYISKAGDRRTVWLTQTPA